MGGGSSLEADDVQAACGHLPGGEESQGSIWCLDTVS